MIAFNSLERWADDDAGYGSRRDPDPLGPLDGKGQRPSPKVLREDFWMSFSNSLGTN